MKQPVPVLEPRPLILGLFRVKAVPERQKQQAYQLELLAEITPIVAPVEESA
jgi:hypothetical protein